MGIVDVGRGVRRQRKGMGHRRPKRRAGIRIDMTPMVDIAFLLLIFYMVTTVFSQPQAMELNLPPTNKPVPVVESLLLTLRIDGDESLWWNMAKDTPKSISFDSLRGLLLECNLKEPKLVTLVKIDKKARFFKMVDIIDEIQIVEKQIKKTNPNFSYRFSLSPSEIVTEDGRRR
ncbi:MAG: biopolymer transporter ExbD [candidate division Zixibacteria bacterium]|nr:biopolymer transporter ExbD [candidate division Zixibacteria bacterium]